MFVVVVFLAASALLGSIATYQSRQPIAPELHHRPGTPTEVVESCRQAVISSAQAHAAEQGATLQRVDATSAGPMRQVGRSYSAPIEAGVVYERPTGQELRQGVIECRVRVDQRSGTIVASIVDATP